MFMPEDPEKPNIGVCENCYDLANSHPMMRKDQITLQMYPLVAPAPESAASSSSSSSAQTPVPMMRDPLYRQYSTADGAIMFLSPRNILVEEKDVPMVAVAPAFQTTTTPPQFSRQPERLNKFAGPTKAPPGSNFSSNRSSSKAPGGTSSRALAAVAKVGATPQAPPRPSHVAFVLTDVSIFDGGPDALLRVAKTAVPSSLVGFTSSRENRLLVELPSFGDASADVRDVSAALQKAIADSGIANDAQLTEFSNKNAYGTERMYEYFLFYAAPAAKPPQGSYHGNKKPHALPSSEGQYATCNPPSLAVLQSVDAGSLFILVVLRKDSVVDLTNDDGEEGSGEGGEAGVADEAGDAFPENSDLGKRQRSSGDDQIDKSPSKKN
jgi:hypothetical protein